MRAGRRHVFLKHLAVASVALGLAIGGAAPAVAHTERRVLDQRAHVKQRARAQVGAPYSYGGTSPRGFDCSGFTRYTFDDHGANLPHSSMDQFDLAKRDGFKRIWKKRNLRKGDLVFHKTTSARVGHAGIYIGNGKFISSTSSSGVRVRSMNDPYYWGPRFVGATRVPALIRN